METVVEQVLPFAPAEVEGIQDEKTLLGSQPANNNAIEEANVEGTSDLILSVTTD